MKLSAHLNSVTDALEKDTYDASKSIKIFVISSLFNIWVQGPSSRIKKNIIYLWFIPEEGLLTKASIIKRLGRETVCRSSSYEWLSYGKVSFRMFVQ